MAGELTIDEKLAMTLQALKMLRTQLFELELHGIANKHSFMENMSAAKNHSERLASLKSAVLQLEVKHDSLLKEKSLTSEQSSPSNQNTEKSAPQQSSDQSQSDRPQPRSQSPQSEVP